MDKKFLVLQELLPELDAYAREQGQAADLSVAGFGEWLRRHRSPLPEKRKMAGEMGQDIQRRGEEQQVDLPILITFMYRYAKLYTKKILHETVIGSTDDFSYLIIMMTHESLGKTELIERNAHEKAGGMEIIRRLIRKKLLKQFWDDEDRRSRRVSITAAGRKAVLEVLPLLDPVNKIITGPLSPGEKHELMGLLRKLDHFHYDIYLKDREKNMNQIVRERLGGETC